MATQIVIGNNDFILIDDSFHILWVDKGKDWDNNWIPNTIHYVVYNNVVGDNEIQTINPATGDMEGNTLLSDPALSITGLAPVIDNAGSGTGHNHAHTLAGTLTGTVAVTTTLSGTVTAAGTNSFSPYVVVNYIIKH